MNLENQIERGKYKRVSAPQQERNSIFLYLNKCKMEVFTMKVENNEKVTIQINIENSKSPNDSEQSNKDSNCNNNQQDHADEPDSGTPPSSNQNSETTTSKKNKNQTLVVVLALIVVILLLVLAGLALDSERFEHIIKCISDFFLVA